jgi:S-(hydroxymethyl)glutathione dehydrogenase/alcohol dehydrogenase
MAEQLGATHSCETAEQAQELITELTRGVGADKAIVTVGIVTSEVIGNAFNAIRKGGTVVVIGPSPARYFSGCKICSVLSGSSS